MARSKASLEEQVKQRKEQAENRDIYGKAFRVARYLGKWFRPGHGDKREEAYQYNKGTLRVEYESGSYHDGDIGHMSFSSVEVFYKENLVYSHHVTINTYVPGTWERTLGRLDAEAQKIEKRAIGAKTAKKVAREAAGEREERAKWGL